MPFRRNIPPEFAASLRERGLTIASLAARILSGRCHVNRVLLGYHRHGGGSTRLKLARILTPDELSILGWNKDGSLVSCVQKDAQKDSSPILFHVEQNSVLHPAYGGKPTSMRSSA